METCFGDFGCFVFASSLYDLRPKVVGFASWVGDRAYSPWLIASQSQQAVPLSFLRKGWMRAGAITQCQSIC